MIEFNKLRAIDFCDDVRDGTHDSPKHLSTGKMLITSKNIKNNSLDLLNASYISEDDFKKINERSLVEKNDILYSMIGTIGLVYRVDNDPDYAIKNMGLFKIKDVLKSKWLYYYLQSTKAQKEIMSKLNGSTQKFISLSNLRNLEILYPESNVEMQKAVSILDTIDRKIQINEKINVDLNKLINSIFFDYFSDSNEVKKVEEIADITIGKTPPRKEQEWFSLNDNDIKWISIADLGKCGNYIFDSSEKLTQRAVEKHNIKVVPKDTILLSFKLTVGRIAITTCEMTTNEAIAHFNLKDNEYIYYLYSYLKNYDYSKLGSTSSIATAINSKIVKSMPVLYPKIEMVKEYNKVVIPLFNKIKNNESENITLEKFKQDLINKIMSGEFDLNRFSISSIGCD